MSVDDDLIDRFLEGEVSADEAELVTEWLESPASLQRFVKRAELHADLRSSLRRKSIQDSAMETCDGKQSDPAESLSGHADGVRRRPSILKLGLGIVAFATAASLLIAYVMSSDETQPDGPTGHFATVVSRIDALLTNGESDWDAAELVAGDYQLRRGLLHLQFNGGVMVYMEAPAQISLVSGKRLVLQHGRLSASVPPEGIGFTVDTPEAEVVDFGTEFSVDVESGTSEVHVFDGLVRVQPRLNQGGVTRDAVDLRTSQAVKINEGTEKPVDIELAPERFIRNFDEPKRKYVRSLRQLSPVAFYRMAIRDKGLLSEPPQYSGKVLTGEGTRPPHARGVFAGGSLRVGASSTGRGGRINHPPALTTGQFTLAVFVYLDASTTSGMVATNIRDDKGNFELSLDENGVPQARVREIAGELRLVASDNTLPLATWRHIVVTADGDQLRLYENGQPVASALCGSMATGISEAICLGMNSSGTEMWNGRIDELALFGRALSDEEIAELYQAALEEIARSE
jgi:hypothetical protein